MTGFILTTHADHNPLVAALRKNGIDVRGVSWKQPLPDLTGCWAFYGNLFDEIKDWSGLSKRKRELKEAGVPYVFWNRDAPWNTGIKLRNLWALKLLKPVDIYLSHSLQGKEWFGGEAHYFPNAAQPVYYSDTNLEILRVESSYQYDVSYFGSIGNRKDRNARLRAEFLDAFQAKLSQRISNLRLLAVDTSKQTLSLKEQLRLIRTSKINLNVGAMCDLPGNASWGLPERIFGIPAAGGFLISDIRKHFSDTFSGGSVPVFDGVGACADLIEALLSDWKGLRTQAENQHLQVLGQHTYRHRAQHLVELLTKYRTNTKDCA